MRTFFNGIMLSFPDPVDGKISTVQFLDASKSVVSVIVMSQVRASRKRDVTSQTRLPVKIFSASDSEFLVTGKLVLYSTVTRDTKSWHSTINPVVDPACDCSGLMRYTLARSLSYLVSERFGKVFAAVKYDMNGNIQKINNKYCQNKERYAYLNDMVLCEKEADGNTATDALMWLRRALHFIHNFFFYLYEDTQQNKKSEDITPYMRKAYTETLEQFHGWMAKHLFGLLSRMIPSRSQLISILTDNNEELEDIVFQEIDMFLKGLNANIVLLYTFYAENRLESHAKSK